MKELFDRSRIVWLVSVVMTLIAAVGMARIYMHPAGGYGTDGTWRAAAYRVAEVVAAFGPVLWLLHIYPGYKSNFMERIIIFSTGFLAMFLLSAGNNGHTPSRVGFLYFGILSVWICMIWTIVHLWRTRKSSNGSSQ